MKKNGDSLFSRGRIISAVLQWLERNFQFGSLTSYVSGIGEALP